MASSSTIRMLSDELLCSKAADAVIIFVAAAACAAEGLASDLTGISVVRVLVVMVIDEADASFPVCRSFSALLLHDAMPDRRAHVCARTRMTSSRRRPWVVCAH